MKGEGGLFHNFFRPAEVKRNGLVVFGYTGYGDVALRRMYIATHIQEKPREGENVVITRPRQRDGM